MKLQNLMPQKQLDNVYGALTEINLHYASAIWGSIPNSKKEILQNLKDRTPTIIERGGQIPPDILVFKLHYKNCQDIKIPR